MYEDIHHELGEDEPMINDLDETIKQLLVAKGKLNPREVDIRFEAPDREWVGKLSKPTLNLFLYDLHENTEFRMHDWNVNRTFNGTASKTKPPAWIDLSYLITVWANAVEDEHRLLWHVLAVLLRFPILPEEVMQGTLANIDQMIQTKTAQTDGSYRSLAELWGSLETPLKPSVNYVVTAPLDRAVLLEAPVVTTKVLKIDQLKRTESIDELLQVGGRVFFKGKPSQGIPGLEVTMREHGLVSITDERGSFKFSGVPQGEFTLSVVTEDGKRVDQRVLVPTENYDIPL